MRHPLGINGLSKEELYTLIKNSESFVEIGTRDLKKVPALRGKTIINLFLEPSTRTRTSFEIAGKRLSADVINIGGSESSTKKGETLLDTAKTLQAMSPDIIVVRHKESGTANYLANHLKNTSIVNAGDGTHEHPTQAILDCLTLKQALAEKGRELSGLKVAIVGDVKHSRVARSNIFAHSLLGNEINLVGPSTLVPEELVSAQCYGAEKFKGRVKIFNSLSEGIKGVDIVIVLRMQLERQEQFYVPNLQEYTDLFCITEKILSKNAPHALVLHPGPMNRGIEISSDVADGRRSLIDRQVSNGVAVRMAVLFTLAASQKDMISDEVTVNEAVGV